MGLGKAHPWWGHQPQTSSGTAKADVNPVKVQQTGKRSVLRRAERKEHKTGHGLGLAKAQRRSLYFLLLSMSLAA